MNSSCSLCSSEMKICEFLLFSHLFIMKCVEELEPQKPQEYFFIKRQKMVSVSLPITQ